QYTRAAAGATLKPRTATPSALSFPAPSGGASPRTWSIQHQRKVVSKHINIQKKAQSQRKALEFLYPKHTKGIDLGIKI
ncbi:hypothetical protein, partial [Methylacidiphilum caldifontis]|uniref:hypothetical protein n=1 Tax=Methylacidiphilum caldifontis TaxID=2795386 RepID=UPI001ABC3425